MSAGPRRSSWGWGSKPEPAPKRQPSIEDRLAAAEVARLSGLAVMKSAITTLEGASQKHFDVAEEAREQIAHLGTIQSTAAQQAALAQNAAETARGAVE